MRVVLVANLPTHYRVPLYAKLAEELKGELRVLFYSDGGEWYWNSAPETDLEGVSAKSLAGFWVGRTRITIGLVKELLFTDADVIIKDPNGKFALPVTYLLARFRRKPFVFWASLWVHPDTPIHRITRPLLRHIYRQAGAIVTYGRHVSRHVIAEGADPRKVFVSPQAVRDGRRTPPLKANWTLGAKRLIYVGRLEAWKGVASLLYAVHRATGVTLTVVGDGSQRAELEALAASLDLEGRVTFVGQQANDRLYMHLQSACCLIVPSRQTPEFSEPWALVVNEAMNAGCLVICSDAVGAAHDGLVEHTVTGLVFSAGNVDELACHLRAIALEGPEGLGFKMATAGYHRVQNYNHAAAAAAFVEAALYARATMGRDASDRGTRCGRRRGDRRRPWTEDG